ncbi:MAG: hypothetical protein ABW154_07295 [Dyella sp.]
MRQVHAYTFQAGGNQTKEKPTTPSGDTLDDTGQDNHRQKEEQSEKDKPEPKPRPKQERHPA